jgi:hypothetical protein
VDTILVGGFTVRPLSGGGFSDGDMEYRTYRDWRIWHNRSVCKGRHASFWFENEAYFAKKDTVSLSRPRPRRTAGGFWEGLDWDGVSEWSGENCDPYDPAW